MSVERSFAEQLPEPRTLWVRYTPKSWRGAEGPWLDPTTGRMGGPRRGGKKATADEVGALDDVLYLPPPAIGEESRRDELAAAAVERGLEPVLHVDLGTRVEQVPGPSRLLLDELPRLVSEEEPEEVARLAQLAFGVEVVWQVPAIAGLTVGAGREERLADRLRALGATAVHVDAPRLEGADLRRLAEAAGAADSVGIFHAQPVDSTALMRSLARAGFQVLHPRPLGGVSGIARDHRRLAGVLGQVADLWLRARCSPSGAQSLFRAAREIDRTGYDLKALHREGNLKVLEWLDGPAVAVAEEWLDRQSTSQLDELTNEVLA